MAELNILHIFLSILLLGLLTTQIVFGVMSSEDDMDADLSQWGTFVIGLVFPFAFAGTIALMFEHNRVVVFAGSFLLGCVLVLSYWHICYRSTLIIRSNDPDLIFEKMETFFMTSDVLGVPNIWWINLGCLVVSTITFIF